MGCLVCVICNSIHSFNNIHSFIFKLLLIDYCLLIFHTLKMCTSYFMHISQFFKGGGGVLNLDVFSLEMLSPEVQSRVWSCFSSGVHNNINIPSLKCNSLKKGFHTRP